MKNSQTNEELGDEGQPATDAFSDVSKEHADESPPESMPNRSSAATGESKPRRHAKGTEPFEKWERNEMETLLGELNGHLGETLYLFLSRFWALMIF
jgi:phospholipase D1/2